MIDSDACQANADPVHYNLMKKTNKIGLFKTLVINLCNYILESWNQDRMEKPIYPPNYLAKVESGLDNNDRKHITFNLHQCDGGVLITVSKLDPNHGYVNSRYVIHSEDKLGDHIDRIVSFELIRG